MMRAKPREELSFPATSPARKAPPWAKSWIAVLCLGAITVGLQMAAGAYWVEFASDPDEPAHTVTGIAVDSYVRNGLLHPPVKFLLEYYNHYPKVAIGHWPPVLYLAEAGAMLLTTPSRYTLLLLQAFFASVIAWLVFREMRGLVGAVPAFLGAVALLCTRAVQVGSAMIMADLLLALTMFLACLAFARYAESGRTRDAILFSLWLSAAVMTKGTGWSLCAVPAFVMVAGRNWRMPLQRGLWVGALIVAALCVPWYLATFALSWKSLSRPPGLAYALDGALALARELFRVPGGHITLIGLAGIYGTLILGRGFGRARTFWVSLMGMVCGLWLTLVIAPVDPNQRYLLAAVPPMFVLAAAGARQCAAWIFAPSRRHQAAGTIFAMAALLSLVLSLPVKRKIVLGFIPVAAALDAVMPPQTAAVVVSDSLGEGALISELALKEPNPKVYVVRGSKLLASQGWEGDHFFSRVHSGGECSRILESVPVSFLIMDRRAKVLPQDYFYPVESMLRSRSSEWKLVNEFPNSANSPHAIALYRRASGAQPLRALPPWVSPAFRSR